MICNCNNRQDSVYLIPVVQSSPVIAVSLEAKISSHSTPGAQESSAAEQWPTLVPL